MADGGTADPSASLGMTKGRVALPFGFDDVEDEQQVPPLRFAPVGMTHLLRVKYPNTQNDVSSRPERTRISCHAALDKTTCFLILNAYFSFA